MVSLEPNNPRQSRTTAHSFVPPLLGVGLLSSALLTPSSIAHACTYIPVNFTLPSERVPLAGPIIMDVDCHETEYCRTGAAPSMVVSVGGVPVAGTLELVHGDVSAFLVWRTSSPLQAGREYLVEIPRIEGESLDQDFTLKADADFFWVDPPEPAWSFGSVVEDTGEQLCCFAGQACVDHCFTEHRVVKAVLAPNLGREPERAATVYALRWTESDGSKRELGLRRASRFQGPSKWDVRAPFDEPAAKYCATLEVRNLADGSKRELTHCSNADSSVRYGERVPFTPDASLLSDCQVPPGVDFECEGASCRVPSERYRLAWCEANESACRSGRIFGRCEQYQRFCSGPAVGPDVAPDAGTSEQHVDATSVQTSADDSGSAAGDRSKESGCSASPADTLPTGWASWAFAALCLRIRRWRPHHGAAP